MYICIKKGEVFVVWSFYLGCLKGGGRRVIRRVLSVLIRGVERLAIHRQTQGGNVIKLRKKELIKEGKGSIARK